MRSLTPAGCGTYLPWLVLRLRLKMPRSSCVVVSRKVRQVRQALAAWDVSADFADERRFLSCYRGASRDDATTRSPCCVGFLECGASARAFARNGQPRQHRRRHQRQLSIPIAEVACSHAMAALGCRHPKGKPYGATTNSAKFRDSKSIFSRRNPSPKHR